MKTSSQLSRVVTFCASVAFGCGAAVAVASVASVSQSAPSLRPVPAQTRIVRLDPVTVTGSRATFDAVRAEETALARAADAKKIARG